ncbi:NADP-dependent isocitrate dehydrogenase [Glutamicibacter sp. NPDC087831]|uniref:NADP-dependent isocitrate dehydrogenase n=1 Tax=Glutamicibacter sp. NPDC087831 TaxID=3363998 RepID=UPI003824531C
MPVSKALRRFRVRRRRPKVAEENEQANEAGLAEVQGKAVDIAGYYRPDEAKTSAVMRPSATLNKALELLTR